MRRGKGRFFSPDEITKIKSLLAQTDMSFEALATRMSCAKSSIVAINRKHQIRFYNGRRTQWANVLDFRPPEGFRRHSKALGVENMAMDFYRTLTAGKAEVPEPIAEDHSHEKVARIYHISPKSA